MTLHRTDRLANQFRQEISEMIQRGEIKDHRIGFLTIAGVRVSKDLSQAQIFLSVFGSDKEAQDTLEALQNAQGFIRGVLSRRLHLRRIPALQFRLDHSIEEGHRINELLKKIADPAENPESAEDDDPPPPQE